MKAGIFLTFEHPDFLEEADDVPSSRGDAFLLNRDITIASKAEAAGYDSIWTPEHHFTGYVIGPDPIQTLAFIASRTSRISLGTAAIIMPWHNPVRVAGQVALLDNLSNGRFILGVGRGVARSEFTGLMVDQGEARERYAEGTELLLNALENGYVEHHGKHFQVPKRYLRPRPTGTFKGRRFSASNSPETAEIVAKLGLGFLIAPQKPWDSVQDDFARYSAKYEEVWSEAPPRPIVSCQVFVDEDPVRAREVGRKHLIEYFHMAMKHYMLNKPSLVGVKGYEHYATMNKAFDEHGDDAVSDGYISLQICGTPKQCLAQIEGVRDTIGCDHFNAYFSYGRMSDDEAYRNMAVWTDKVLPGIHAMAPGHAGQVLVPA